MYHTYEPGAYSGGFFTLKAMDDIIIDDIYVLNLIEMY